MSLSEFEQAINRNKFLKDNHMTIYDQPFDDHEIEMINYSQEYDNISYGGKFDADREVTKKFNEVLYSLEKRKKRVQEVKTMVKQF